MSGTPAEDALQSPAGGTPHGAATEPPCRQQFETELGHVQPALHNLMQAKTDVVEAAMAWYRSPAGQAPDPDVASCDLLFALGKYEGARTALRIAVDQLQQYCHQQPTVRP